MAELPAGRAVRARLTLTNRINWCFPYGLSRAVSVADRLGCYSIGPDPEWLIKVHGVRSDHLQAGKCRLVRVFEETGDC